MIKLYPFQEDVLEKTKDRNRVAYYMDMGLGKTFVGAEKLSDLGAYVNVLICQKSKISDWIQHFKEYYFNDLIFDLTDKKQLDVFLNHRPAGPPQIIGVINYEMAWRRPDLLKLSGFTLMLDESSMIQNESAKRTKFVLKMKPQNVILLSGTPTAGKYENLLSQAHLLGWPISKRAYWNTYIELKYIPGIPAPLVAGYKNVERLKQKFREHGAVFMKSDEVLTLPEQVDIMKSVPQTKEYKKFLKDGYILLPDGKEMVSDTTLTARLDLRMLCGSYSKEKLQAFEDLVSSTEDRLIVFYNFDSELRELTSVLESMKRPISSVNGHSRELEAYEQESNSVTLIQYQAGAMGLNLQKANRIIYFTLPERSELFEQSRKRIHRIGQSQTCFYYFLLTEKSIEISVLDALKMRKDYTDALFTKQFGRRTKWESQRRQSQIISTRWE